LILDKCDADNICTIPLFRVSLPHFSGKTDQFSIIFNIGK